MRPRFSAFMNMPRPLRMAVFVFSGGSVLALLYMFRFFRGPTARIVFIGLAVVALLVFAYTRLAKKMKKRKAKPLEQGVAENAASTPQAVTEASRRAAMEDLRKKFQQGVETFRSAGKNLYSLPWYLIVGEPGSGKTEAIRHSNIGFPPGLHDPLQGAGGTINMNWWFTNHAVVLDTAGRLMFEEVEHGSPSEWGEFLKLLDSHRRNCPINGMLLVIPADSLIMDTADDIQKKGQKIAQQLDHIQRILGIRFPVFVVVTKCDLINGFREFFDNIDDPQLQHQILGWSNPAPLDERFDPALVEQHLQSVMTQLMRRRLGLLIDPVPREDASARRTDEVDSLYAFPKSLAGILSRLRRYLEMIFVTGEWSPKPLFLRGIYFTSSMREGEALDAELAEVLGVPVTSLPEGRVWERERAYFLRDLFMDKIFREKGLVTRAAHAKRHYRRRKAMVLGAGFVAAALLLLWTLIGWVSLRRSIGRHRDHFVATATISPKKGYWKPVVERSEVGTGYVYNTGRDVKIPKAGKVSASRFHSETLSLVKKGVRVPAIFRLAGVGKRRFSEDFRKAQERLYVLSVLRPVVEAARQKMLAEVSRAAPEEGVAHWTEEAPNTRALAQLIRLAANRESLRTTAVREDGNLPNLDDLFVYVLGAGEYSRKYEISKAYLQKSLNWIYSVRKGEGQRPWPPVSFAEGGSPDENKPVETGVTAFIDSWKEFRRTDRYKNLADKLKRDKEAEANFLRTEDDDSRDELAKAKADLDGAVQGLGDQNSSIGAKKVEEIKADIDSTRQQAEKAYRKLLRETESQDDETGTVARIRVKLEETWNALEVTFEEIDGELSDAATPNGLLALVGKRRLYEYRYDICMATSASHVAAEIEKLAGDYSPRLYPEIPLTNMRGRKQFYGGYHPDAAVAYLRGWKDFDSQQKDKLHPPRPELLTKYEGAFRRHLSDYLGNYVSYWDYEETGLAGAPQWENDFKIVQEETWQDFRDRIRSRDGFGVGSDTVDVSDACNELDELFQTLTGALAALKGEVKDEAEEGAVAFFADPQVSDDFREAEAELQAAHDDFKDVVRRLRQGTYTYPYITVHNWALAMPAEAQDCHLKLLSMDGPRLQGRYFYPDIFECRDQKRLDIAYWKDIALQSLRLILGGAKPIPEVQDGLDRLARNCSRFPLIRLDKHPEGEAHLTPTEAHSARDHVDLIERTTGFTPPKISGVYYGEVNSLLKKLWNVNMSDEEGNWVQRLHDVLEALPKAGTSWACTVRFYRLREEGVDSPSAEEAPVCELYKHYREFELRQAGRPIDRLSTTDPTRTYYHKLKLFLDYPDGAIAFRFYRYPGDEAPGYERTFGGRWACIEMFHDVAVTYRVPLRVRQSEPDAESWVAVPLRVSPPGGEESERLRFWVALEFRKPFPRIESWPAGRPRAPGR